MADSYDTIVIGSGPGGYVAAIRSAQLGMKTAVVEKDKVGGRCLNYACIPAKAVLRTADVLQEVRDADEFGLKVADPEVDYPAVMARREKVIATLVGGVSGLFKKNGIDVLEGEGRLAGGGQVAVDGTTVQSQEHRAGHRVGAEADPGRELRRPRDRHRGGVGAARAAEVARRRGRGRVGRRDRLGLRAARHGGPPVRGARARAADRGPRHLQDRRAPAQEAGDEDPHEDVRGERRVGRQERDVLLRRRAGRGRVAGDRRGARARRRGARAEGRRRRGRRRRADQGRRRASAPAPTASGRSATSCRARRWRTRPPTRA